MKITAHTVENFQIQIEGPAHSWMSDEPVDRGGDGLGPTPYEFLLSGLASCTAITCHMYANRKEWPLEKVHMTIDHKKVAAKDCDDCESTKGKVDIIDVDIRFEGDLDEQQLDTLYFIAGRCPVHQSLITETKVNIRPMAQPA